MSTTTLDRKAPWFRGVGTDVTGALTAADAIKAGNLDWEVELRKVYTTNAKGNKTLVPGAFANVRIDNEQVMGLVRAKYRPVQNREVFEFADNLVDSGQAKYSAVGPMRHGQVVFAVMDVPEQILVGGTDPHAMSIMMRTSHDGSTAVGVYAAMTRLHCTNAVTLFTKRAPFKWTMPHTSTLEGKLLEARQTIQMSFAYAEEFAALGGDLMNIKVDDDRAVEILTTILPVRPKTDERIDAIMDVTRNSDTNGFHGTGWGLINGITEYLEHHRETIKPEATMYHALNGDIHKWRNRAADLILASS